MYVIIVINITIYSSTNILLCCTCALAHAGTQTIKESTGEPNDFINNDEIETPPMMQTTTTTTTTIGIYLISHNYKCRLACATVLPNCDTQVRDVIYGFIGFILGVIITGIMCKCVHDQRCVCVCGICTMLFFTSFSCRNTHGRHTIIIND
jgi:hypothetical protein